MRNFLFCSVLILFSISIVFAQDEVVEPVDNGLDSIELGALLQDFSKRKDIAMLVDPRVNAKIQLLGTSSEKVDFAELHTILNLHQFGMIQVDGMYVVAPMFKLKQRSLVSDDDQRSESETILTVVDVKHVPAAQMVPILRPLIPQHGSLSAYLPSNKLILYTSKHNTKKLLEIVKRLDVKTDFAFATSRAKSEK